MSRNLWSLCIIGVLFSLCVYSRQSASSDPADAPPVVTIAQGTLLGVRTDHVEAFKGIPFAAAPIGALRWRPPQPAEHWNGVRRADAYGPDCLSDDGALRTTPSEDCLYLNVWRPQSAKRLPVMVWIYGGGFTEGGTSTAIYDGSHLAAKGVVLVSFNYRLGRFGFFAFPALSAEQRGGLLGNYGLMDQIAALSWVKANIAAFGGDPSRVMVFGESAGGSSVHMLLTSNLAAGLFEKAGIESGGGRDNPGTRRMLNQSLPDKPSGEAVGVNFARAHGIDGTDAAALAALRALPASDLLTDLHGKEPATYPGPMVDGQLLVPSLEAAYQSGRFARVPLLIGANSADFGTSDAKTYDDVFAPFISQRNLAMQLYDPQHADSVPALAARVAADRRMVEPARFDAAAFATRGVPVYEYRFSYVPPVVSEELERDPNVHSVNRGAQHASEIPYVFDTVATRYGAAATAQDLRMAELVSSYWVNFAKTGNPNGRALPVWPAYSPQRDELMNFTQDGPVAMPDPWRLRLDLVTAHSQ